MFDVDTQFDAIALPGTKTATGRLYPTLKRMADLAAVAILALPVGLVVLFCAIAIKLSVGGPVLFFQARYGQGRRKFFIVKLRTMTVAETGNDVTQAIESDPRVTRVGAILRRFSFDELPQLWNVAIGQMSIIGPRPHAIAHDDTYGQVIPGYDGRFIAKPGITGLAQVRGQRGPTPTVGTMASRIQSDLEYVSKQSLLLDTRILFQTLSAVLKRTNAF
jgi:putative colanic acid biosynthesis UDP-glucose lipid carrier transferase